jgi:hypothetical protein
VSGQDARARIVDHAFAAFAADIAVPPPLSLRGGNDVDGYRTAAPFDPSVDRITDEYLESYTFWGLGYLDAQSWRHYLPHLFDYAVRRPDDPRMAVEALVRSLRPPDRYPPRLATVTAAQEGVIAAFLEFVSHERSFEHVHEDAQQALDEWWGPGPRSRPTKDEIEALRRAPVTCRAVTRPGYRLDVPESLTGSGVRDIPEESRRVETWGGFLCGDAHTTIAVNVLPIQVRSLEQAVAFYRGQFREPIGARSVDVRGASHARRCDGLTPGDSPAEPQALTMVLAESGAELVVLTVRTWPREDLAREVERIVGSFVVGSAV